MPKLTAFVASSFLPEDQPKVQRIHDWLDTFRPLGFEWVSAEPAESEKVSQKVQELIRTQDILVGILTARHPIYTPHPTFRDALKFWKGKLRPKRFSAPPWVLQECGFALAAGKHLVLYVESDVEPGGLQGDLEYIPYPYPDTAETFIKTNEMITRLIAKNSGIVVETVVTQEATAAVIEQEKSETSEVPDLSRKATEGSVKEQDEVRFEAMMEALDKKDFAAAEKHFTQGLEAIKKKEENASVQVVFKSFYFARMFKVGEAAGLDNLKALAAEFPKEEFPHHFLGFALKRYQEFEQALNHFEAAMAVCSPEEKPGYAIQCAICLTALSRHREAEQVLFQALQQDGISSTNREALLAQLYKVLLEADKPYEAFGVAEHSLQENPGQKDLRFSLGLDYHKSSFSNLFLHHFSVIKTHHSDDEDAIHNLALGYEVSKLPILSVDTYKEAFGRGVLLSGTNLGRLYLNAGMADEAKTLVDNVSKRSDGLPAEVSRLLADIDERRKKESSLLGEIQTSATEQKHFLASFGRAYVDLNALDVAGEWKFPFSEVTLKREQDKLSGETKVTKNLVGMERALMSIGPASPESLQRKEVIKITGQITNRAARLSVSIKREPQATFYGDGAVQERTFYVAFASDGKSAQAAEIKDGKIEKIYTIQRK